MLSSFLIIRKEIDTMPKILFTDLDDTLLTTDKTISPYTRRVLDQWCAAGNKFVLCSGRPSPSVMNVKKTLSLDYPGMYLIGYNGACIYECDTDRIIAKDAMTMEECAYVLKKAKEMGVYCHTYSETAILSPKNGRELASYQKSACMQSLCQENVMELVKEPPYKCLAIELDDLQKLEDFRLALAPWAEGKCTVLYSAKHLLEIFPATSGKGAAVEKLCSLLGIPLSDSFAAGDQENDLSMLTAAGCGIAMANGVDSVKKAADVITEFDNDHDGLAKILEKYM